jgi:hypothetical protein
MDESFGKRDGKGVRELTEMSLYQWIEGIKEGGRFGERMGLKKSEAVDAA